ncbi:MAG: SapC family protein [Alteromonadales bacterium]|nr:SapC family protein [Alteromonadales bacterium]
MSNHALVSPVAHKDIKIITDRSAKYGDNLWYALTFPREFRSVQAHYPIFFNKNPNTGKFISVALFGFKEHENLFLDENGWNADYIPTSVLRSPFLIGTQKTTENGVEEEQRMLTLDMDNPRVSNVEGEALFLPFGGNSDFLEKTSSMMEALHLGAMDGQDFTQKLEDLELLEPCTLDITLDNGHNNQMIGFYIINEDKVDALTIEQIQDLRESKYLQAIYMAIASQSNIRSLVTKKNALVAAQD